MVMLPFSDRRQTPHRGNRSKSPATLVELAFGRSCGTRPIFDARHPQLLLGIIQQLLRYLLAFIQAGQLCSMLGILSSMAATFGFRIAMSSCSCGTLLIGKAAPGPGGSLLSSPQFVENILHITAGFNIS